MLGFSKVFVLCNKTYMIIYDNAGFRQTLGHGSRLKIMFVGFLFIVIFGWQAPAICQGSLSDVTYDLFGGSKYGVIAAFGDFNADKMTDIFVLADGGKRLNVLMAEQDVTKERVGFWSKLLISGKEANNTYISSLAPGDFDGDGMMDVMVTRKKDKSTESDPVTVQVYWGNSITDNLDTRNVFTVNETLKDQPSVIDANGDMIPDLLGDVSGSGERVYILFWKNRSYTVQTVTNGTTPLDPLRIPQSSAFYDFNQDLVPDLCMVSEKDNRLQFEIWLNEKGVLTWKQTILSPPEMKQFGRASFSDLNDNREINIILPGCLDDGGECMQSVVYVWGRGMWHNMHVGFERGGESWHFATSNMPLSWLNVPLFLRIGDFNLDGYPDALAVLKASSNHSYATFLMLNIASSDSFTRTFHLNLDQSISAITPDPPIASFYDFMENGILDVLLTVYTDKAPELRALEQDFTADAYFLKVMVVSGLCEDVCPNGRKPYGVNQVGPVVRFRTTTSQGDTEIGVANGFGGKSSTASQLSQSAYYSLQLPFEIFGLGQTPNFVDILEVGIQNPPNTGRRQRSWPSIIPNSQVVVIPHPPDSPSRWITKLYVTPSRLVLLTGISLLGTCVVVAIVVVLLHWRERVEDKKEKLQEAQRFHFDAM